jgi:prefoldin beta subunit
MAMDKETEKKISQMQMLEQGLQNLNLQKQQLQSKFLELGSALDHLDKTDVPYKIIGNIMIKVDKEELKAELEEKKRTNKIRIGALEKQESSMREKAKKIQNEVMSSMNGDDNEQ